MSFILLGALSLSRFACADEPGAAPSSGVGITLPSAPLPDADSRSLGDRSAHYLSESLSPLALMGGAFLIYDNKNHRGQARSALQGIALTGLVTVAVKRGVNEERPNGAGSGSFPSGHASLAFSMATALSEYHPQYQWLAYGTAAAISASRVEVGAHHWHDVVAGAALGYFTTKHFMHHRYGVTATPSGIRIETQF